MATTNTASSTASTTETVYYRVDGIVCYACVGIIENAASAVPGVLKASVSYVGEHLRLEVLPDADLDAVSAALARRGYRSIRIKEREAGITGTGDMRRMRLRILVTFALSLLLVHNPLYTIHPWIQFAAATVIQAVAARQFYRDAFYAVSAGSANMSVLVALGTLAAYMFSTVSVFRGAGELFYDAAGTVLVLVMLGKYLERSARLSASEAILTLMEAAPAEATLLTPDGARTARADNICRGDRLLVRRGEFFPADATVMAGSSRVDESGLTGESRPVKKAPGDKVYAATINMDGRLELTADCDYQDSVYARLLISLMTSLNGEKTKIQRLTDRVCAKFVPAVLLIALLTLFLWYGYLAPGDFSKALTSAVSVLIVACPCAMGLATPLAVTVSVGALGKSGIFVKNPAALELLAKTDVLVFDKTGTLTVGPEDRLRSGAPRTVETLDSMGIRVLMLTGDTEARALPAAAAAGITEFHAGLLPEDKAAFVAALRQNHTVTMVGDGVNDALSLSAADAGIALGRAAEVSVACADVVITQNRIAHVLKAVYAGRVMLKNIRRSLFWALIYNVLGLLLAACGVISPVIAGAAMSLSSLSVVLSARSLDRKFHKITFDRVRQS